MSFGALAIGRAPGGLDGVLEAAFRVLKNVLRARDADARSRTFGGRSYDQVFDLPGDQGDLALAALADGAVRDPAPLPRRPRPRAGQPRTRSHGSWVATNGTTPASPPPPAPPTMPPKKPAARFPIRSTRRSRVSPSRAPSVTSIVRWDPGCPIRHAKVDPITLVSPTRPKRALRSSAIRSCSALDASPSIVRSISTRSGPPNQRRAADEVSAFAAPQRRDLALELGVPFFERFDAMAERFVLVAVGHAVRARWDDSDLAYTWPRSTMPRRCASRS